ncbi:hypothetical protein [Hyphomicrobium sp. LHD-15]|uniref:DUF7282 domain-containing protein n=1 Tax=Hyphomicrobium sp. LHD-15 TaxID=3072142 RepID=UPI00280F9F41|nr:hypothetical protein [Hyphomicrobium sp. LHD-15]MDQ8699400.1 hypothetical protein [Hyphomicrobium sp. LHD-15]
MIKQALALTTALTLGAFAAQAESMISTNGLKASETAVSVGSVKADKDGYLVVHATDFTGTIPGTVIGHAPVKAGESAEVSIPLERKAKAGAKLIVMLHEEGDNNTAFDAADKPATSGRGPVQQIVTVE